MLGILRNANVVCIVIGCYDNQGFWEECFIRSDYLIHSTLASL